MEMEQAHREIQREIEETRARMKGLQDKLEQLEEMKRGIALWLAHHNGHAPEPGWADLGRSEAVERLLSEASRPLAPLAMTKMLAKRGRQGDTPNYVRAALAYLKTKGKARQVRHGLWALVNHQEAGLGDQGGEDEQ